MGTPARVNWSLVATWGGGESGTCRTGALGGGGQPRRTGCLCWREGQQLAGRASREGQGSRGAPPASPEQLKLAGLKLIGYNFTQQRSRSRWGLAEGQPGP